MSQGDSVYDIIDTSDHLIMRTNLAAPTSLEMGKKRNKFNVFSPPVLMLCIQFIQTLVLCLLNLLSPPQTVSSAAVSTLPSPCGGRVLETSWF